MKYFAYLLLLLLTGCVSGMNDPLFVDMLNIAPQEDSELKHPEWRDPVLMANLEQSLNESGQAFDVRKASAFVDDNNVAMSELQNYLASNGIRYQVREENHFMVQLNEVVTFQSGSAEISSEDSVWLAQLGAFLATQPSIHVVLNGHTDNTGSVARNSELSQRRADAVKLRLLQYRESEYRVPAASIVTHQYGSAEPMCTNQTAAGRACNRRVEIHFMI